MRFELTPHPAHPAPEGVRLSVTASREARALRLAYRLEGPLDQILWPAPQSPVRADGLWRSTCCEAFIQAEAPAYLEVNASPTGAWAAYAFATERDENRADAALLVAVTTETMPHALILNALVTGDAIPWDRPWRAGLTAVLEDAAGRMSYWALNHPKDRPDFHDPKGFTALLSATTAPGDAP